MKKLNIFVLLLVVLGVTIQSCGPSEEELRAAEQARLDSLRQVEQQRIALLTKAREDSLAKEAEKRALEEDEARIKFAENGNYAIQVGAWRSEEKARSFVQLWSDREYPTVYVAQFGDEKMGDIWYRVRIGFFDSKAEAEKLGVQLSEEINTGYWISKVGRSANNSESPAKQTREDAVETDE